MAERVVKPGENLFDVAVLEYGHIQAIYDLAVANGVGFTDTLEAGVELQADDTRKYSDYEPADVTPPLSKPYKETFVASGQNIFDIAIQLYGNIEGIKHLVKENGIGLTDDVEPGVPVKSDKEIDRLVVDYLNGRNIKPATGMSAEEANIITPEGIGYWAVGIDFVVS